MRSRVIAIAPILMGALLLTGCPTITAPFPASLQSLVEGAAAACVRVASTAPTPPTNRDRELCSLYFDLRALRDLERHLYAGVDSPIRVTPLPCPADGPGCPWRDAYHEALRAGFEKAFGDPSPQPNTPLPFEIVTAEVQLEKAAALRDGLMQAVRDLDGQIETLRPAVDE